MVNLKTNKKVTFAALIICVVFFVSQKAFSIEDSDLSSDSPLLVLLAAKDDTSINVEKQLVGELRLALDGLEVEQVVIEREDFLDLTLPQQLSAIQPLIRRFSAKAVLWVTIGTSGGYFVQFVVTDRGNATVRTVEAVAPEELALAVREMLDTGYLFAAREKPEKKHSKEPFFSVELALGLNGGLYGHKGNSLCGGTALGGRLKLTKGLFTGIHVAGKYGPKQSRVDGLITGWRLDMTLSGGYRFKMGRFETGPIGEITAFRSSQSSVFEKGDYQHYKWWSFRGALGLEVLIRVSQSFSVFVDWTAGGITRSHIFERESNNSTALATPIIDFAFKIGFITGVL